MNRAATVSMDSLANAIKGKFRVPSRFEESAAPSVWNEFASLDQKYQPVNLGQGYPDFSPPPYIVQKLNQVANSKDCSLQLSTASRGLPKLRNVLSSLYSKVMNRQLNPNTEFLITCGAYESLYCAISSLVTSGDEVIVIEPSFDCYVPMTQVAGGIVKYIPLKKSGTGSSSTDYVLDEDELRAAFTEKTKMIVLNSPMNPLGKVFTVQELSLIAELCIKYNVVCLSDEVYEWLVFEPAKCIKIATLPGMWERTITVGSAGKALWVTGWKCGWSIAPEHLIDCMMTVHRTIVSSYITPIQEAVARCFEVELSRMETPESWLKLSKDIACNKRDYFVELLRDSGFKPIVPDGGFFIVADWSDLGTKLDLSVETDCRKDYRLAKWMIKQIGLSCIPPTAFYSESNKYLAENLIRFCYLKTDETLNAAAERLRKLKSSIEKKL